MRLKALIRPVGHLLPCQVAREKAIISKSLAFSRPKDGRRCPTGRMRASSIYRADNFVENGRYPHLRIRKQGFR